MIGHPHSAQHQFPNRMQMHLSEQHPKQQQALPYDEIYKATFRLLTNVISVHQSVDLLLQYHMLFKSKEFHQNSHYSKPHHHSSKPHKPYNPYKKTNLPPVTRQFMWMLMNVPIITFATYVKNYFMDLPKHMHRPVLEKFSRRCNYVTHQLKNDLNHIRIQWLKEVPPI